MLQTININDGGCTKLREQIIIAETKHLATQRCGTKESPLPAQYAKFLPVFGERGKRRHACV